LGEKTSQLTLLCLAFDRFKLRYAADVVLNSTVSTQIVYLWRDRYARKIVRPWSTVSTPPTTNEATYSWFFCTEMHIVLP